MRNFVTIKTLLILMCCLLQLPLVFGQKTVADTAFLAKAKSNSYQIYAKGLGDQTNLFNGLEYKEHVDPAIVIGSPYFGSSDWIDGNIYYDSGYYTNVGLMYDMVTDRLILDQPFSHFKLELISEKVKFFEIAGRTFKRLTRFSSDSTFRSGFYDVLYEGKVQAYVHHIAERKETPKTTGSEVEYNARDIYYIIREGTLYRVRSRASVLSVFKDRKKTMKKKLRSYGSQIDFRMKRGESIALLAKLYDESAE